jgi:hypothetical protein
MRKSRRSTRGRVCEINNLELALRTSANFLDYLILRKMVGATGTEPVTPPV